MMKKRPPAPAGYDYVDSGLVRSSDLVWDVHDERWMHPTKYDMQMLGTEVEFYYATCRKSNGLPETTLPGKTELRCKNS